MTVRIPAKDKRFSQPNTSTVLGNLSGTFNADLAVNKGKILFSNRARYCTYNGFASSMNSIDTPSIKGSCISIRPHFRTSTNFSYYAAFAKNDATATQGKIFYSSDGGDWIPDADVNAPTLFSGACDMKNFTYDSAGTLTEGLFVSGGATNKIYYHNTSNWVAAPINVAGASKVTFMVTFGNRLYYVADNYKIGSMGVNLTPATFGTQYTTTIAGSTAYSTDQRITGLLATQDSIFILTISGSGGKGNIYVWNGIDTPGATGSSGFSQIIPLSAVGAYAGIVKDNIPYILDANGYLQKYTGSTFFEVARLPEYDRFASVISTTAEVSDYIHPNGMCLSRNNIHLLFSNGGFSSSLNADSEYAPSGVWEYIEDVGLVHRSSPCNSKFNDATTKAFGDFYLTSPGCLFNVHPNGNYFSYGDQNTLIYSSQIALTTTSSAFGLFSTVGSSRIGHVITPEISASEIESTWATLYVKYRKLLGTYSKIYTAYRQMDIPGYEYNVTWGAAATERTFVVDDFMCVLRALGAKDGVTAKDSEVTVLYGVGSGRIAYITNAVNTSGTTWTITVDSSFDDIAAGSISGIRFNSWKKLEVISAPTDGQYSRIGLPINSANTKIQVKVSFLIDSEHYGSSDSYTDATHLTSLDEIALVETEEIGVV